MVDSNFITHIDWTDIGVEEKGVDVNSGKVLIEIDAKCFRLAKVESLLEDSSKA